MRSESKVIKDEYVHMLGIIPSKFMWEELTIEKIKHMFHAGLKIGPLFKPLVNALQVSSHTRKKISLR